jgi:hypothetical protein
MISYFAALAILLIAQGFLLQTAVALTGEAAPRWGRATAVGLMALVVSALATIGFRFTAGIVVWMMFGSTMVWASSLVVGWLATSVVYKRKLRLAGGHAMLVALMHHVMASLLSSAVWFTVGWVS